MNPADDPKVLLILGVDEEQGRAVVAQLAQAGVELAPKGLTDAVRSLNAWAWAHDDQDLIDLRCCGIIRHWDEGHQ